jgi:uncharacterized membrane protein (DUF373 family)
MRVKDRFNHIRSELEPLSLYEKFEQVCILVLTGLIAVIAAWALWHLALHVATQIIANTFDPTDYGVFQNVFGMIFTVIIALEFKRSLLGLGERQSGIVQVRTVILIALLAVVRKLIILDLPHTEALHLFSLAAAVLALGGVYWLVCDREERDAKLRKPKPRSA